MAPEQLGSLQIPSPGFGTLQLSDGTGLSGEEATKSVRTALDIGYRHVDAAQMYGNQAAVGQGLAASDVSREDLFLATKILHPHVRDEFDHEKTIDDANESLDALGVDSVELLYMHWPHDYDFEAAFEAFDTIYEEGCYDHLGVCNFVPAQLDEAREVAAQPIEVLQVEMHPWLQQDELQEYCAKHDITLVAYCPLIRGKAPEVPELQEIAEKHDISESQVSMAWLQEKGAVPIPRSSTRVHIRDNWESQQVALDGDDIAKIDAITHEERQVDTPYAAW